MRYDIIRFYKSGKKKLVHFLVTEKQAKEWCNSPLTRKDGVYFDGFAESGSYNAGIPIYDAYSEPTENNC